jgi:hemolysin activation/secretion protein
MTLRTRKLSSLCAMLCAGTMLSGPLYAATTVVPGNADVGRIEQRQDQIPQPDLSPPQKPADVFPETQAPAQSKNVKLTLREVHITGMSVFSQDEVKDIYASYLGHEITLDTVWKMAQQLTDRYRANGYFLSRVTVPQQEIKDGIITLHVVEGYVGDIKCDPKIADRPLVRDWLKTLKQARPLRADQIESVLLQLNDLPGVDLHAVMEPLPASEGKDGAVRLVLEKRDQPLVTGQISFDNYGSKYLGPYEGQTQLQSEIIPGERTTLTMLSSIPWDEVKYGGLKQEIPIFMGGTLEVYGAYTSAYPGFNLRPEEIKSNSTSLGAALNYSIIRQRDENFSARLAFEGQNTLTDILGTQLTHDDVRAARFGLNYQFADLWAGQNLFDATLSQGINWLGASQTGQQNLSRADARPDFTKFNFDASRLQGVGYGFSVLVAGTAQVSSVPLYSSEQFGYGGQAFGRAFDNSEITGDEGAAGSAELRYGGINPAYGVQPQPYGFYDIGAVWNEDATQTPYAAGSSAGAGLRLFTDVGFSSNLGAAFPLARAASTPLYGNGKNPRYFMQVSYRF